ncbi:LrgA family protein [Oceaniovalibus guishaninsula JLT2003]|uniref:LrgA family protein n=1 Tax=Oceaniovalibus guishaninsula JLT2003 TaxID=1231392 RepID=K2HBI4_9RHOB|nr:CidA/LrgA family protein [Oceaniovalibus guishaninsula]EKE43982.1 LrgA family protein [Oceaniovalibus guishaninsula JLT2003]
MVHAFLALLICQLAGEALTRAAGLPVPGPVAGMLLMLALIRLSARMRDLLRPVAETILAHLSLLFVPAGVGVMGHMTTLGSQTMAIAAAIVGSTVLAIAAGALTFVLVARLTGSGDD